MLPDVSMLFISIVIVYDYGYQSFKCYVLDWHCCIPFLFVVVWYSALKIRVILVFSSRDINSFGLAQSPIIINSTKEVVFSVLFVSLFFRRISDKATALTPNDTVKGVA